MSNKWVCIHGHFYQPPRENPWLEAIEPQPSARPYRDWNERITAECYRPNTAARVVDSQSGQRYYPRAVMEIALELPTGGFVFESEILIEAARRGIRTVSVPIEARYADDRRASHFRPLRDVSRITMMIALRLIRGGLMPRNYWRARTVPPIIVDSE